MSTPSTINGATQIGITINLDANGSLDTIHYEGTDDSGNTVGSGILPNTLPCALDAIFEESCSATSLRVAVSPGTNCKEVSVTHENDDPWKASTWIQWSQTGSGENQPVSETVTVTALDKDGTDAKSVAFEVDVSIAAGEDAFVSAWFDTKYENDAITFVDANDRAAGPVTKLSRKMSGTGLGSVTVTFDAAPGEQFVVKGRNGTATDVAYASFDVPSLAAGGGESAASHTFCFEIFPASGAAFKHDPTFTVKRRQGTK